MQLPAFTHGLTREVKRRSSRIITQLKRQVPWAEATAGEMLDTDETEGLIVLHGPSPLVGSEPHFHLYMPLIMLFDAMSPRRGRLPPDREDEFFAEFLEHDWCVLALQGRANQVWAMPDDRRVPLVSASLRAWPVFPDEPRYTTGSNIGSWFCDSVPMVRSFIGCMGVPVDALRPTVRTRDQLAALLEAHDIRLDPDACAKGPFATGFQPVRCSSDG